MANKQKSLQELYERDQRVWDGCAETYEQAIVGGHPDIASFEEFEEDFFDRILLDLMRDQGKDIELFDVGCGSARLHLHYGLKMMQSSRLSHADSERVKRIRSLNARHQFDPYFAKHLKRISGIDFSENMILLAKEKLTKSGLGSVLGEKLHLAVGSAYEMQPFESEPLPFVVNVCNSIGVMQGEKGAQELFKSMRKAVEPAGGIAVISAYRKEAVPTYALGNYESTMNVSGQPRWLVPDTYASEEFVKLPRHFKRALDPSDSIVVDVFDQDGKLVQKGFELKRDPEEVEYTIVTGHIRMHSDYESHWYSFEQFDQWIDEFWEGTTSYHLAGNAVDCIRANPVQLAVLDVGGHLEELFGRWWK